MRTSEYRQVSPVTQVEITQNTGGAGTVEEPVNSNSGSASVKSRRSPSGWSSYYKDSNGAMVHMVDRPMEVTFSQAERLFGVSRRTLLRAAGRPENDSARLRTFPHRPSVTRTDWLHYWMFATNHAAKRVTKNADN